MKVRGVFAFVLVIALLSTAVLIAWTEWSAHDPFVEGLHDPYTGQRYERFDEIEAIANADIVVIFAYQVDDEMCRDVAAEIAKVAEYVREKYRGRAVVMASGVGEGDKAIRRYAKRYRWREAGVIVIAGIAPTERTKVPTVAGIINDPSFGVFFFNQMEPVDAKEIIESVDFTARYVGIRGVKQ